MITKRLLMKSRKYLLYFILGTYSFIFFGCSSNLNNHINLAELGNKYFIDHNYNEALRIYEEAIKKDYKTLDIFYNSGFIYQYEKKNFMKAEELYKKGLSLYPNVEVFHFALSQLYFSIDNFSEAVKEYKLSIKLSRGEPISINANKARELLEKQGKSKEEINNFFLEIVAFNPKDSYALWEVAEYEKNHENYRQALDKYKRILVLNPNLKDVIAKSIGTCYYKLGDYRTALPYFEEAIKKGDFVPGQLLEEVKKKASQS